MTDNDHTPSSPPDPWLHHNEAAPSVPSSEPTSSPASGPTATESIASEPMPSEPMPSEPMPSEPMPSEPVAPADWSSPGYGPPAYGAVPSFGPAGTPTIAAATADRGPARRGRTRATLASVAVLAALIGGGAGAATVAITDDRGAASSSTSLSISDQAAASSAITNGTVSAAAAKITPSVVTINVRGSSESGTGSGVIIRSDGYILTNDHVVSVAAGGGSLSVETSDGRTAAARIVGRDTTDDLAVIKVAGLGNLTAATFAKSGRLQVGQTVVAVGAPLGLSDTVTSGIVSATARTVRSGDTDQAVFAAVQTDAAINPGNSGGALTDLNGNVVGINAAIATASSSGVTVPGQTQQSGSIGIGFAIPSDEASRVAQELIKTGSASHALLGVRVQPNAQSPSQSQAPAGATIAGVTAGGAAAKVGLQAGDVVTTVDGRRIGDGDDLIAAIRAHAVGDQVTIGYIRGGSSHTVKATLTSD